MEQSTGSFFHDRSTTLGTLMGVTFPSIATFRAPSRSHSQNSQFQPATTIGPSATNGRRNKKSKKNRATLVAADEEERRRWRRRRWWKLCRDDGDCRPASLGEFLEVERRFGDGAFFSGATAELEGVAPVDDDQHHNHNHPRNGRLLFADGRVLPPADNDDAESSASAASASGGLCRFSVVSLTSICSGGGVG